MSMYTFSATVQVLVLQFSYSTTVWLFNGYLLWGQFSDVSYTAGNNEHSSEPLSYIIKVNPVGKEIVTCEYEPLSYI